MNQNPLPLEVTINEFINLVKALELGGYLHHHHLTSMTAKHINALPFTLSIAFKHLERTQKLPFYAQIEMINTFRQFVGQLVDSARLNTFNPSHESMHAACLLGFMLHHRVQIKVGNESRSFADIMYSFFPKAEAAYCQAAPYQGHSFISPAWQAAQQYPSIQQLSQIYNAHLQQQAVAKYLAEQKRAAAQDRFDGLTLSLKEFSFVLEGFIKLGYVKMNQAQSIQFKQPLLSGSLVQSMQQFSQLVRQDQPSGLQFMTMMKEMIAAAKYRQDPASQLLLGFLLHHHFKLKVGNQTLTMAEIFWLEATPIERRHIQVEGGHKFPFIHSEWQQQRGYPGRVQLEQAMAPSNAVAVPSVNTAASQKNYLPGFSQQSAQKSPFVMNTLSFEAALQPRVRCS